MPQANNNPFRKASKSGAEAFAGVDGLTINGGEHTVVGGIKMVITGDYDPKEIQKVRQAAMQDSSTIRTSSILRGAKGGVIDGDTESIAGGSITITGGRGSGKPIYQLITRRRIQTKNLIQQQLDLQPEPPKQCNMKRNRVSVHCSIEFHELKLVI